MKSFTTPRFSIFAGTLAAILLAGTTYSATVTGSIYENNVTGSQNAIPSNVPLTTPDVTFTTESPINFASGSAYTIGEFLNSGGGSTVLTGASQLGNTLSNTLFNFVGTVSVTNGETFTAGHDDGLTLVIGGVTVISAPSGTSFTLTSSTYTGPTGTEPFQLVYGESFGPPAGLTVNLPLNAAVPEPSSIGLLGFALLSGGLAFRKRLNSRS